jgi:two-component system NtrC family sensor kinase
MTATSSTEMSFETLGPEELRRKLNSLVERTKKLEDLIEIISRGKYIWESTFDAITAPVQIVSADYEIVRANLSLAAVGDQDIATVIGRRCYEVFAGRDKPCQGCPLTRALEYEARTTSNLGNKIGGHEFEASAYPLSQMGQSPSAVLYYRDITEERRLLREVIQREKMAAIGMLAGGVAHEINNPLGGIMAFVQLMKKDAEGNATLMDELGEVEKAAMRCQKIVADLLDFSRVSDDRDRRLLDVNSLLEKVFLFVQREMECSNVKLEYNPASSLPRVSAIPDRLQQVFLNLITNACHAMPQGGILTVSTRPEGKQVVVRVRDTGPGIAPEDRDRIFDPFFTTKEPGGGVGLGLSISYRIIKDLGGDILYEDAKGGGAEFIVRLPGGQERKNI